MPLHLYSKRAFKRGIPEMKLDTFFPCEDIERIAFDKCTGLDEVQIYFCHHVLNLVVFGMKDRSRTCVETGWILRIQNSEERHIPFDDVVQLPVIGMSIAAVNKAIEGGTSETVERVKVTQKDIFHNAKRESKQLLLKSRVKIDLLHPVTKEVLHCFWQGSLFTEKT